MSALVIKQIKPSRLRIDAMRLQLLNDVRKVGTGIKADFEKTTATWKTQVKFEVQVSLAGGPQAEVFTTNKIYGYVDKGTEPHVILPKRKKALSFVWGGPGSYRPKTRPGVIGSSGGGATGDRVAFKGVLHPGTKPRNFSKEIQKLWTPRFKRAMEASMSKVAKVSGHAM